MSKEKLPNYNEDRETEAEKTKTFRVAGVGGQKLSG